MVPLLKVIFTNETGQEDSAAWWVEDIDAWIEKLKKRVVNDENHIIKER
jgi:hypothetical protein